MQNNPSIQTYSGIIFHPFSASIDSINIEDIAHSLSNICRFNGHVSEFYSVAQHCVLVSELCAKSPKHGLLHDASEAYIHDIASPLKASNVFADYKIVEKKLQKTIYEKYDLGEEPIELKQADLTALSIEGSNFMKSSGLYDYSTYVPQFINEPRKLNPLQPKQAKKLYLDTFEKLFGDSK